MSCPPLISMHPMLPRRRLLLFVVLTSLCARPVPAHDFWIEPSAYRVEEGAELGVGLRVGEGYRGDPVARNPARIRRFVLVGPAGEQAIAGSEGQDFAGRAELRTAGLFVIGYHSWPSSITLEAAKFEAYLREEGLERIIALRAERQQSASPGREIYSRCAKALVACGPSWKERADRRLGLPLELVPEANPYLGGSGPRWIRLLFQDRPLEGALVVAIAKEEPEKKLAARSEADGRVAFDLAAGRTWLVKAVHMVPAPVGSGADWESLWASLTFAIPAR
jgi:uncharacterized GH25 family protein